MGNTAILAVKVIGDATGGARALDQTGTSAGRMGQRMQRASRIAAVGLAALGVASFKAAKAAAQDQKSQALLANTMTKNAGASAKQIAATEKWIDAQARATGVADDQLRPALGTLVRATGDTAKAQDALRIAMDVSAATGKPLQTVSAALAKGYGGQTTAIGRLVPGLDQATLKSGDMAKVMQLLADKTGGAAATAANTAEGKFAKLNVAMGELQESMGAVLLPVMTQLAAVMGVVAAFAQQHQTTFQVIVGVLIGVAAAVLAANAAYKTYKATLIAIKVATVVFRNAQIALNVAMLANPVGLVIAAIIILVGLFVLAYKKSDTFRKIVQATGRGGQIAIGWIVTKAQELWKKLQVLAPAAKIAKDLIVGYFKLLLAPVKAVIDLVQDLIGWIKKIKFPSVPKAISSLGKGGPPAGYVGGSRVAYSNLPGRGGPGGGTFTSRLAGAGFGQVIQINVTGALDPNAVAMQIEKILQRRRIRAGVTL